MAVAWLIDLVLRVSHNTTIRHRKSANSCFYPYLEAVGKARIMEISFKVRATREQSRIVTIILYLVNFLHSQILSITSYCRYCFTVKI